MATLTGTNPWTSSEQLTDKSHSNHGCRKHLDNIHIYK